MSQEITMETIEAWLRTPNKKTSKLPKGRGKNATKYALWHNETYATSFTANDVEAAEAGKKHNLRSEGSVPLFSRSSNDYSVDEKTLVANFRQLEVEEKGRFFDEIAEIANRAENQRKAFAALEALRAFSPAVYEAAKRAMEQKQPVKK